MCGPNAAALGAAATLGWYFHALPYLLWRARFPLLDPPAGERGVQAAAGAQLALGVAARLGLLAAIEVRLPPPPALLHAFKSGGHVIRVAPLSCV